MTEKLENYVLFRREITSDFREGKISRDEFLIYCWLRLNANPYGIVSISLNDINDDLFYGKQSINYVNKMFLSLKKQRRIYYKKRTGNRGSFQVNFADFIIPKTKRITNLDKYFLSENIGNIPPVGDVNKSELSQTFDGPSQNFKDIFSDIKSLSNAFSINPQVRTRNNDKNNDKDKDTNKSRENRLSFKEDIYTDSFKSKSYEEDICLKIAQVVGEPKMNYLLSVLDRYGIGVIEEGFSDFENMVTKGIKDRPAFFNTKVQLVISRVYADKQLDNSTNLY
jgi:hypothetical protein